MRKNLGHTSFAIKLGCIALYAFTLITCSPKEHADTDDQVEWKEMDDFHAVMADVFHPLKDSGNLEPIKSRAEELAVSASTWAEANLPEKVNNEEVKGLLMKLKDGSRGLADQIQAGVTDDVIRTQLTSLHDLFHSLQEKWYGGGDEHPHH